MTTNEFNSVLELFFSPTSEYNKSRKIGPFTFSLSKENILMEGRIPFSLLSRFCNEISSLKLNLDDFSSPKLDAALRRFNFSVGFFSDTHEDYEKQYDIYLQETLKSLISDEDTDDLILKKLFISKDPHEFYKLLNIIKLYYSE